MTLIKTFGYRTRTVEIRQDERGRYVVFIGDEPYSDHKSENAAERAAKAKIREWDDSSGPVVSRDGARLNQGTLAQIRTRK
jgi:hypothetical protein